MRTLSYALAIFAALASVAAHAHGPQIQITNDNNKIVTRDCFATAVQQLVDAAKSVYVMPLLPFESVWYSRPNNEIDPIYAAAGVPLRTGPGLRPRPRGRRRAGVCRGQRPFGRLYGRSEALEWRGVRRCGRDAIESFRGSNANISSPPANFAITSDSGPFDSVSLAAVAAGYGSDGAEVHASLRFALLGDGSSPTSSSPDGVYLLSLQLSSTQAGLSPRTRTTSCCIRMLHRRQLPGRAEPGFARSAVQYRAGTVMPLSLLAVASPDAC